MNLKIFAKNENKWVVTDKRHKKVLAVSNSSDELQNKIKKLRIKDAIVMFIPPFNKTLAPKCQ